MRDAIGMSIHEIGLRLRRARLDRGESQIAAAKAAGIKQPSLSEIETGATKVLAADTLIRLCAFLKVRPEWAVTGKGARDESIVDSLNEDEIQLLVDYRAASGRWRVAIRHMAKLKGDRAQDEAADTMNFVLAKIATEPVPDSKLNQNWINPNKRKEKPE